MRRVVAAFEKVFIPPQLRRDPESLSAARRVVGFHLAIFIWAPVYAVVTLWLGAPICATILLWGAVLFLLSLLLLRIGKSPALCGNSLSLAVWSVCTALAIVSDGAHSPIMTWYACVPVFSLLLAGMASGIFWAFASALAMVLCAVAPHYGFPLWNELTPFAAQFIGYTGSLAFFTLVFMVVWMFRDLEIRARIALREANRVLETQSSTDALTGIANRRCFDHVFEQEWKRHQRAALPLSLIMIDIDFFKLFNDRNGHLAGDVCLQEIARVIQAGINRPGDFASRYGGEEFAVILPNTDGPDAVRIAEEIRQQVKSLQIRHPNSPICPFVTISLGVSTVVPLQDDCRWDFLREADMALYRAKHGRDQTVYAGAILTELTEII